MKTLRYFLFSILLAQLAPFATTAHAQHTDNVVLILDGSGSMNGPIGSKTKMTAAKLAILNALGSIAPDTQFGFIVFSQNTNGWAYPLGDFNREAVWNQIKNIEAGGNTPLGKYIKSGADRLLQQREKNFNYGTYRLLVVTDGEASDPDLMESYARELVNRGITLNVIGVGMKNDHSLKKLAHQYVAANDAKSLSQAVNTLLAEVSDTAQNDLNGESPYEYLEIFPNDGAALEVIDALSTSGNQPLGSTK